MKATWILLVLVLCAGLLVLWGCPSDQNADMPEQVPPPDATATPSNTPTNQTEDGAEQGYLHHDDAEDAAPSSASFSGEVVDGTRVVQVDARRYEFVASPIVVKAGEPVRLEITANDVEHGFGLDDFDIDQELPPNEMQTVEFTPEEPGEHHFHCTHYCGPGHDDMHGTLIVRE